MFWRFVDMNRDQYPTELTSDAARPRSAISHALVINAFTAAGFVTGFVNQSFVAFYFGAGHGFDAFNMALAVPLFFTSALTSTAYVLIIPYLSFVKQQALVDLRASQASLIVLFAAIFMVTTLALLFIAQPIVRVAYWAAPAHTRGLALAFVLTVLPSHFFAGLASVLSAVHNQQRRFFLTSLATFSVSLVTLTALSFAGTLGLKSLVLAATAGPLCQFLILFAPLAKDLPAFDLEICRQQFDHFTSRGSFLLLSQFFGRSSQPVMRALSSMLPSRIRVTLRVRGQALLCVLCFLQPNLFHDRTPSVCRRGDTGSRRASAPVLPGLPSLPVYRGSRRDLVGVAGERRGSHRIRARQVLVCRRAHGRANSSPLRSAGLSFHGCSTARAAALLRRAQRRGRQAVDRDRGLERPDWLCADATFRSGWARDLLWRGVAGGISLRAVRDRASAGAAPRQEALGGIRSSSFAAAAGALAAMGLSMATSTWLPTGALGHVVRLGQISFTVLGVYGGLLWILGSGELSYIVAGMRDALGRPDRR